MIEFLLPDWPAPPGVQARSTVRRGGVSVGDWAGLNLAAHVGDRPEHVARNRTLLTALAGLPAAPRWLDQVHGAEVVDPAVRDGRCEGDAAFTRQPGVVCAVLTADCLPVLFAERRGRAVAAAHAGWRGLAAGVLEATLARFDAPGEVIAWMGPAIGPEAFEVGEEVRQAFVRDDPGAAEAFVPRRGRWLCDLFALARRRLEAAGIGGVYGGGCCTYSDPESFYSHRRDGRTGRQASLIWIEEQER